jgi:hypothetical protein
MKLDPLILFFFSLDSAKICRYFWLNTPIPRCSMGINCYSLSPRKKISFIPSHNIKYLLITIFFYSKPKIYINKMNKWFENSIHFHFYLHFISISIRFTYFNVYLSDCQIVISCTKHFNINPSDIFILTMGWRVDGRKRLSFPVSFFYWILYLISWKNRKLFLFQRYKKKYKIIRSFLLQPL